MGLPIVAIVGRSGAGKTHLLRELIPRLRTRGYRVGALKHAHHDFLIDYLGKDSFLLEQAGAEAVLVSSPAKLAFICSVAAEPRLKELLRYFDPAEFDLLLAEGFHASSARKIGVSRQANAEELDWLTGLPGLLALTVGQRPESPVSLPIYRFDQLDELIEFLEDRLKLAPRASPGAAA